MSLKQCINEAKYFGIWLHEKTNDRNVFAGTRERTAHSILQLSEDIGDAIIVLIESNLPGPALSLARPLFETYVRGFWLLKFASDEEVARFVTGKCPKFPALLKAIENDEQSGGAWIHANANANLNAFHDLTHGGAQHVRRRSKGNSVEPNYPVRELKSLICFGNEIRIRIGVELLSALNDKVAITQLHARAQGFRLRT